MQTVRRLTAGGSDGNERLTVITGIVLIALLAALGVTIVRIHSLLWEHLFIGMLLLGPIMLKLASTGYRFVRYYTRNPVYRRKGPPPPYLRALGPLVVLTTIVVFASGVALLLAGPSSRPTLFPIHKYSFFLWLAATGVHVLAHLPAVWRTLGAGRELRGAVLAAHAPRHHAESHDLRAGRTGRALALIGALAAGLMLALALIPEFGPWLHHHRVFIGH